MAFILEIKPEQADASALVYSGVLENGTPALCKCPNCNEYMFPVFSIHRNAPCAPNLSEFYIDDFITFDVCPSCSHSLKNYYVKYEKQLRVTHEGFIDGNGPSNFIDQPFHSRAVEANTISASSWNDEGFISGIVDRKLFDGVCHQIGGTKLRNERKPLLNCLCCGNENLTYIATIDNDDLNIPLYENSEPRSLIIGDMQSLNVLACSKCTSLNYGITI